MIATAVTDKKPAPDASDSAFFREQMADAQPLRQDKADPFHQKRSPRPLPQPAYLRHQGQTRDRLSEAEVQTGEYLEFVRPGIQKRLLQALRRGDIEIGLELDLHGLTVHYAQEFFDDFLRECQRRKIRCARIIHGKGYRSQNRQPVLKQKVNYWLRLREEVLAFCSAARHDGGSGAVYVLLRNPSKKKLKD
jgi:DNA-nicking Smr family endonuclease